MIVAAELDTETGQRSVQAAALDGRLIGRALTTAQAKALGYALIVAADEAEAL